MKELLCLKGYMKRFGFILECADCHVHITVQATFLTLAQLGEGVGA